MAVVVCCVCAGAKIRKKKSLRYFTAPVTRGEGRGNVNFLTWVVKEAARGGAQARLQNALHA
jgi:hypothetical protein